MRLRYASFIQMPMAFQMAIKYSASLSPRWVGLQALSSAQLENDFSLGMKWTGQGCIRPYITAGRRQGERLFGSSIPSHTDKTAEQHTSLIPLLPLVYREQCALGLQIGSFCLQFIGPKFGTGWGSNHNGTKKFCFLCWDAMPCQSGEIQYK